MTDTTTTRRPFHGSCHCGQTQFIVFLDTPHQRPPDEPPQPTASQPARDHQEMYRCNCSACHKAAHFHIRLPWAPEDFLLLAPRDPFAELGDYRCNGGNIRWLFCKNCGVRCFLFQGQGESIGVDLDALGVMGKDGEKMGKQMVWRPKADGWAEGRGGCYLSVNGHTIDSGQEGFDMGRLTEAKVVLYLEAIKDVEEQSYDKPFAGGSY